MKAEYISRCVAATLLFLGGAGCERTAPFGSLVLTKAPASAAVNPKLDILSARYPVGSRVVLRETPFDGRHERILSGALIAAGNPVVSYDGRRVFFVGKAAAASDWQIYETLLAGWGPRVLTSMPRGAMSPTLLPDGSLVFISPVPEGIVANTNQRTSALFVQKPGGQARQLTFSSSLIIDSTVLSDGRILFVSMQHSSSNSQPECALYTINSDGTEVTAFAGPSIPPSLMERPRQIADGCVAVLVSNACSNSPNRLAEFIQMARPWQNFLPLFSNVTERIHAVQPTRDNDLLICAEGLPGNSPLNVFRVSAGTTSLRSPLVADSKWNFLEAVEVSTHRPPMGRLSTVDLTKSTGKILCLDANFTRDIKDESATVGRRVRVIAETSPGIIEPLGEIPVQTDGSFLAEVPADIPLGFEVLDQSGRTLRRQFPSLWVRPGENRSCVGCHEPPNRAPHNRRPLAVNAPVPSLGLGIPKSGSAKSEQ